MINLIKHISIHPLKSFISSTPLKVITVNTFRGCAACLLLLLNFLLEN